MTFSIVSICSFDCNNWTVIFAVKCSPYSTGRSNAAHGIERSPRFSEGRPRPRSRASAFPFEGERRLGRREMVSRQEGEPYGSGLRQLRFCGPEDVAVVLSWATWWSALAAVVVDQCGHGRHRASLCAGSQRRRWSSTGSDERRRPGSRGSIVSTVWERDRIKNRAVRMLRNNVITSFMKKVSSVVIYIYIRRHRRDTVNIITGLRFFFALTVEKFVEFEFNTPGAFQTGLLKFLRQFNLTRISLKQRLILG